MPHPVPPALDRPTVMLLVRESMTLTPDQFLANWFDVLLAFPKVFSECFSLQGQGAVDKARILAWNHVNNKPKPKGSNTVVAVLLDDRGAVVEAKGSMDHYHARAWLARKVANTPGATGILDGKPMSSVDAHRITYGGRIARQVTKKQGANPITQKCQQTKVTFSRG